MSDEHEIAKRAGAIFRSFAQGHYDDMAVRGAIPAAQAPMLTDMAVAEFEAAIYKSFKEQPLEPKPQRWAS